MTDHVSAEPPISDHAFIRIFNRLCVAVREPEDDTGLTATVYFQALRDLPESALAGGAEAFMNEPGRRFLPSTGDWRRAARAYQASQARQESGLIRTEPWHEECAACGDTGWVRGRICDGGAATWPETLAKALRGSQHYRGNRTPTGYRSEPRTTTNPSAAICGRPRPHPPHTFTQACGCRAANRTWQRHHRQTG